MDSAIRVDAHDVLRVLEDLNEDPCFVAVDSQTVEKMRRVVAALGAALTLEERVKVLETRLREVDEYTRHLTRRLPTPGSVTQ